MIQIKKIRIQWKVKDVENEFKYFITRSWPCRQEKTVWMKMIILVYFPSPSLPPLCESDFGRQMKCIKIKRRDAIKRHTLIRYRPELELFRRSDGFTPHKYSKVDSKADTVCSRQKGYQRKTKKKFQPATTCNHASLQKHFLIPVEWIRKDADMNVHIPLQLLFNSSFNLPIAGQLIQLQHERTRLSRNCCCNLSNTCVVCRWKSSCASTNAHSCDTCSIYE